MLVDLAIALLAALAGFLGAIWILLLWVGDRVGEPTLPAALDPILGHRDQPAIYESRGPFIPMPDHLRTHDEMVAWMTKELPRLVAEAPRPER